MSDFLADAERAALRDVAHLLPAKWQQMIDVVAASVPATPPDTVAAPTDPAAARLEQVEHIVVVMLENRSFDHMLGYLSLPPAEGGKGRTNVDGLTGPAVNVNDYNGTPVSNPPPGRHDVQGRGGRPRPLGGLCR